MKILITGITGLLGSYLAKELLGIAEIHGLKRKTGRFHLLGKAYEAIHWHEGDINDYQSLEAAIEGMDMIIHAAGLVSFSSKDKEKLLRINVEGTANVVNIMLEKNVKKLVYISSVSALGKDPEIRHISENYKWTASPDNTPYAISKHLGELEVWRGNQEGLEVLVFNLSVLLAKISDQRSSASIYQYVLRGSRFYPKGIVNYIDIRDACAIMVKIMHGDRWNERFIVSRESISYKKFFDAMALAFQIPAPSKRLSNGMLNIVLLISKLSRFVGTGALSINKQTARLAQLEITFENNKVQDLLNFDYTELKDTLRWAAGNES